MNPMTLVIPVERFLSSIEDTYGSSGCDHATVLLAIYLFMNDHYGLENNEFNSELGNLTLFKESLILDITKTEEMDYLLGGLDFANYHYLSELKLSPKILKIEVRG